MAAGWHPDPTQRYPLRYWNGSEWSPLVSNLDGSLRDIDREPVPPPPPANR